MAANTKRQAQKRESGLCDAVAEEGDAGGHEAGARDADGYEAGRDECRTLRFERDRTVTHIGKLPKQMRKTIDRGISTGWRGLDHYLQGLRPGEMTVVTADTGTGKTTFCLHLCVNCCEQGAGCWINSWEMKPEIVLRKVASVVLRKDMKHADFTAEDCAKFDSWCNVKRLYINQNTTHTSIDELYERMRYLKNLGVKVVLLDHLDYLVRYTRERLHEAIEEAVKKLHEIAFELEMHILLICHPRQSQTGTEEIGMHMLKGSSAIKQYADNIVILHRCSRYDIQADKSKTKVHVAKNRMFGSEGFTYLFYQDGWDGYLGWNELN